MRCFAVIIGMLLLGRAASASETGADLSWRWDDAAARVAEDFHPRFEVAAPDGGRFVFSSGWKRSRLRRVDPRGAVVWRRALRGLPTSAAAMVLDGDTLYAALYNGGFPGCRVAAFDARSGARRWEKPLQGLGFIAHSAYVNRVQMQLAPRGLVIYGKEWRGRYVEILDPADGRQLAHRLVDPELTVRK
jgi:outer membrane protein assembly factor BamB